MRTVAEIEVTAEGCAGWGCAAQQNCKVVRARVGPQQSAQCMVAAGDGCCVMAQGVPTTIIAMKQAKDAKQRTMERIGFASNAMV